MGLAAARYVKQWNVMKSLVYFSSSGPDYWMFESWKCFTIKAGTIRCRTNNF